MTECLACANLCDRCWDIIVNKLEHISAFKLLLFEDQNLSVKSFIHLYWSLLAFVCSICLLAFEGSSLRWNLWKDTLLNLVVPRSPPVKRIYLPSYRLTGRVKGENLSQSDLQTFDQCWSTELSERMETFCSLLCPMWQPLAPCGMEHLKQE